MNEALNAGIVKEIAPLETGYWEVICRSDVQESNRVLGLGSLRSLGFNVLRQASDDIGRSFDRQT